MIKINDLKFSYRKSQQLFEDLTLNITTGHVYGLLGGNGEGKSTLLKLISGMIFPQKGSINCLGSVPSKREPSFISQIYYIPEEIFPSNESIEKYVQIRSPFYPNFSHTELNHYLKEFELDPKKKTSSMSLGQKKKFAIAFALACNTKLLIMDEPTNGLDIPSKGQFRRIISQVATEERVIIISTHQVRDLDNIIDSIIILENSKIVINNSIDTISQKLSFRNLTDDDDPLYEERGVFNRKGIVVNSDGEPSKVDIEMLFNAVVKHPQLIGEILGEAIGNF
ncbi:MAG: ABC transporter ATP-binding protein [Rikenellaceae bacterium]